MARRSGFLVPPTFSTPATASAGSTQNLVTPTTWRSNPRANSVSVMLGTRETIRCGGPSTSSAKPNSSRHSIGLLHPTARGSAGLLLDYFVKLPALGIGYILTRSALLRFPAGSDSAIRMRAVSMGRAGARILTVGRMKIGHPAPTLLNSDISLGRLRGRLLRSPDQLRNLVPGDKPCNQQSQSRQQQKSRSPALFLCRPCQLTALSG